MQCPRCQQENPPQAKFCLSCATPLALRCANCGTQLPAGAKFCFECATPVSGPGSSSRFTSPEAYTPKHLAEKILTSKSALEGERKQVTVLFADLKGSMELLADRDPEEVRKLQDPVLELMMEAVHRYEGTVNQVMGDGIMALFGAPLAHEDHAVRACYAALRMQDALRRYAEDVRHATGIVLQVRVGLHSGDVVVRSIGNDLRMDYTAVGQTTNVAARMEQLAATTGLQWTYPRQHAHVAEAYLLAGQRDAATRLAAIALEKARAQKQRGQEAETLWLSGEIAASACEHGKAEAGYREAMTLASELGMRPLVAHCHLGLGKLSRRTGKREQAQEHLTIATTMYREVGMTYWLEKAEAEIQEKAVG